jgi:hypothetical protein
MTHPCAVARRDRANTRLNPTPMVGETGSPHSFVRASLPARAVLHPQGAGRISNALKRKNCALTGTLTNRPKILHNAAGHIWGLTVSIFATYRLKPKAVQKGQGARQPHREGSQTVHKEYGKRPPGVATTQIGLFQRPKKRERRLAPLQYFVNNRFPQRVFVGVPAVVGGIVLGIEQLAFAVVLFLMGDGPVLVVRVQVDDVDAIVA